MLKAQAFERIKGADPTTEEILRAQIEEMDWLVNEGGKPRTKREIDLEHERLDQERETSEGLERFKVETRIRALEMAAPVVRFNKGGPLYEQRVQRQKLVEKLEAQKKIIENLELLEERSTNLGFDILNLLVEFHRAVSFHASETKEINDRQLKSD